MPIYDFRCEKCEKVEEDFAHYEERTKACSCGGKMTRLIRGTHGINMGVPTAGYYDETLGAHIATNAQKRRLMEEQGVSEKFGKGWY